MLFQTVSYARVGLLGNPSDGYFGKTIAFSLADFPVELTMFESPEIHFQPGEVDEGTFTNIGHLVHDVHHYGYYGGIRLLKAVSKVFAEYCFEHDIELPDRKFTVRYQSAVPRLVGLGGSSAICTAMFKALMRFYEVDDERIPREITPTLCWRAEHEELGIHCGMQDRVIQIYQGMVFMDFEQDHFESHDHGMYTPIEPPYPPNLYVAYDPDRAGFSGIYHRKLRMLFDDGPVVLGNVMSEFADLAQQGHEAIVAQRFDRLPELINTNFDLRRRVFSPSEGNVRMVDRARSAGASAKFAGSGGTIVGTYEDPGMFDRLSARLGEIGCRVIRPRIAPPGG